MATTAQFAIVIASYNNAHYFEKNLASVTSQHYRSFHVYYIDDASTDGTADLVQKQGSSNSVGFARSPIGHTVVHVADAGGEASRSP